MGGPSVEHEVSLDTGRQIIENLNKERYLPVPVKISKEGKWLWPGFGDNSRVLKWIYERATGTGHAVETPLGLMPAAGAIDTKGTDVSTEDLAELLRVDRAGWLKEIPDIRAHYATLGTHLPKKLQEELSALEHRLQ